MLQGVQVVVLEQAGQLGGSGTGESEGKATWGEMPNLRRLSKLREGELT